MINADVVADPSRDLRERVAEAQGVVEFSDKIWFHRTASAVIDAGRCTRCGTCIAACPSDSIGIGSDGLPTLVRMCTGCSSCWDFCPLGGLRAERLEQLWLRGEGSLNGADVDGVPSLVPGSAASTAGQPGIGYVRAAHQARAAEHVDGAQDGGVVTALLTALLEQGYIDGALLSQKENALRGQTVLATTAEQVRQGAGSVYDQTYPLSKLAEGLLDGVREIALVGTPCQITGLRALARFPWPARQSPIEKVKLAIALFCTRSFDPQLLAIELLRQGLNPTHVAKVDIRDGWLRAYDADGTVVHTTRARTLSRAALKGCEECADFTGAVADIAVGSVGSRPGYTTVLIRTERGAEAWERARNAFEAESSPDLDAVAATAARNRTRAQRALRRSFGPQLPLWVRYSEHLRAYLGTDRPPVAPPPHRSHHYTVAC